MGLSIVTVKMGGRWNSQDFNKFREYTITLNQGNSWFKIIEKWENSSSIFIDASEEKRLNTGPLNQTGYST